MKQQGTLVTHRFSILISLVFLIAMVLSSLAEAQTILFTQKHIDSIQNLLNLPEAHLYLNKKSYTFTPSSGMKFLGLKTLEDEVQFSLISKLANVQFKDIDSSGIELKLNGDTLEVRMPILKEGEILGCRVGAIKGKNVVILVKLSVFSGSQGKQYFNVSQTQFLGDLKGTGLLSISTQIVRKLAEDTVTKRIRGHLKSPLIMDRTDQTLLTWAHAYTGEAWNRVVRGSVKIQSGLLSYDVE